MGNQARSDLRAFLVAFVGVDPSCADGSFPRLRQTLCNCHLLVDLHLPNNIDLLLPGLSREITVKDLSAGVILILIPGPAIFFVFNVLQVGEAADEVVAVEAI